MTAGTLFIVATPIGNLDDLSPRARQVLAEVDLVAAEDTRVTGRLLSHLAIRVKQVSLHDYNEEARSASLIEHLNSGKSLAIVSDSPSGSATARSPRPRSSSAPLDRRSRLGTSW